MPFTLEGRVLPSYAIPDGVPASERRCPTCPEYVVRCAHDPWTEGRVVWLFDNSRWGGYGVRHRKWGYGIALGRPAPCLCGCGTMALQRGRDGGHYGTREEADAAFERLERIMLGREQEDS